jgi:Organic solute transporter Ostalpha
VLCEGEHQDSSFVFRYDALNRGAEVCCIDGLLVHYLLYQEEECSIPRIRFVVMSSGNESDVSSGDPASVGVSNDATEPAANDSLTTALLSHDSGTLVCIAAPIATSRTNRAPPTTAFFRDVGLHLRNRFMALIDGEQRNGNEDRLNVDTPSSNLDESDGTPSFPQPTQIFHRNLCQSWLESENFATLRRTIRRSGNYIAYFTVLTMLILVPMVLYRALVDRKLDIAAIHSARVMVCGTVIMSMRLVYLHLTHWFMPDVQKYVVRILWMVPIYAIQSYLSLRYHHARVYMSTIRDFYEAFVIASFVYFLMELLGGQDSLVLLLRRKAPHYGRHKFPISLVLQPWEMGEEFMLQCKHGVLQYVVFKTTATILIFLCEYAGVYGEGRFEWFVAYPYLCFFQNISVMYALYCLVVFFHACNEELHRPVNWHPLGKFLCIKGVVFFTWWQGVVIFYLRDHGIIEKMGPWSSIDVANGFIDYCIVVEMVGFAIAHSYTFTYTEYLPGRWPQSTESNSNETNTLVGRSTEHIGDGNCPETSNPHHYRPPATLPQPMRFRDALRSSIVPHETLQDIQRLRVGVEGVLSQPSFRNRGISLADMNRENAGGSGDPELEHPSPQESEHEITFV